MAPLTTPKCPTRAPRQVARDQDGAGAAEGEAEEGPRPGELGPGARPRVHLPLPAREQQQVRGHARRGDDDEEPAIPEAAADVGQVLHRGRAAQRHVQDQRVHRQRQRPLRAQDAGERQHERREGGGGQEAVNAPFLFFAGEVSYLCFTGSQKYF